MSKNFQFYMPVDLKKGEDGEMKICGVASTEDKDLQGEVVKLDGLDISELKRGRGVFNDDHRKGIENVIGIVESANILKDKGLYVEGTLLPNEKGKNFYSIMNYCQKNNTSPRVQMSIEGTINKRTGVDDKVIAKAKVDKIALTLDPVNRSTYAQLLKSLHDLNENKDDTKVFSTEKSGDKCEVDESSSASTSLATSTAEAIIKKTIEKYVEMQKAINVSDTNYNDTLPQNMKGGTALTKESLDKKKKAKSILKAIKDKYPELDINIELIKKIMSKI